MGAFSVELSAPAKRGPAFELTLWRLFSYFKNLRVGLHEILSLLGFFVFLTVAVQLVSGTMLALSLIPEPMLVPAARDEEDLEDLYIDDFFWLHERGVDLAFVFMYMHLSRKLFIGSVDLESEAA